tara:strand:- start:117 stop:677 length:561 start_codon:yes stop_codon:yes gene_type:complete
MFNKGKDPALPEIPANANSAPPKRSNMKSKAPSILSGDLVMTGSISSEGEVQLDGSVEGDVRAGALTIGEEASVKGEIVAETVVIRGRVTGSVRARQVQLASTARIEGDIVHSALSVESGAFFDGNCRHSSDPLAEKSGGAPKASSASTASSAPSRSTASSASTSSSSSTSSPSSSGLDMPSKSSA